jgi:hypothetical protein
MTVSALKVLAWVLLLTAPPALGPALQAHLGAAKGLPATSTT